MKQKPATKVPKPMFIDTFWTKPHIIKEVEKNLNKWKNS